MSRPGERARGWRAGPARVAAWFGVDSDWERVPPDPRRTFRVDAVVAAVFLVDGLLGLELLRSIDGLGDPSGPIWLQHVMVATGTIPLAWRRRWPLAVAAVLSLHMLVVGMAAPGVAVSITMQVAYFFALFTGVAWARDRRAMLMVVAGIVLAMAGSVVWQFGVGNGVAEILSRSDGPLEQQGLFGPIPAYLLYTVIINVLYFGGAIVGGQTAWRAAQRRERLVEQARTIEQQATDLKRRAVVEERLRIARELHDVVAHHVSVTGIQAAAARRTLRRDPVVAETALQAVEASSREGVAQMRALLGTLRSSDDSEDPDLARAPEPGLADVAALAASASTPGLAVRYDVVENPPGALAAVPAPVGLSLYRTVQEALANVRRHSTASTASVSVRVESCAHPQFPQGYAEVEVVDNGRPRSGTSGSGLGLLGVRERLATHGGVSEIGPRVTGGYRVRVRMPLGSVVDATAGSRS
ncbi:histidine kinase [Intrasporangium sp. DVR]|uniref:sensor histidine kinase n=1 Tax=Intrasporangium sp. DVR TaxID=3127867 RepID=UPI00313A65D2